MTDSIINKCKENGDGIYAFFCDHLSMDANRALVVKDNEIVTPKEIKLEIGECKGHYKATQPCGCEGTIEFLMNSDSPYYGSMGFSTGIRMLKEMFPGLKTYYCNVGYYTFPSKWMQVRKESCYAKACDEMLEIIHYNEGQE